MKTIHILLALLTCTHALLTFEAIRNLTALQIELKHRIRDFRLVAEGLGQEGGKGSEEVVLADTYLDLENDGELELVGPSCPSLPISTKRKKKKKKQRLMNSQTIAAALHTLNLAILLQLEKPMPRDPAEGRRERPECAVVVREYHDFLAATIRLVALVRDCEVVKRWGGESAVFVEVAYLQALWASRKTVCYVGSIFLFLFFSVCSLSLCLGSIYFLAFCWLLW